MKVRRHFAHSEAFEFTQAMYDKKESVPHGVKIAWMNDNPTWYKNIPPKMKYLLVHNEQSRSEVCVGACVLKDILTGETMVFYPEPASDDGSFPAKTGMEFMLEEFDEETN